MSDVLPYKIIFFNDQPTRKVSTMVGLKALLAWSKGGIINIDDDFYSSSSISSIQFCKDAEQFEIDGLLEPMVRERKSTGEILAARAKYKAEYRERYRIQTPKSGGMLAPPTA